MSEEADKIEEELLELATKALVLEKLADTSQVEFHSGLIEITPKKLVWHWLHLSTGWKTAPSYMTALRLTNVQS